MYGTINIYMMQLLTRIIFINATFDSHNLRLRQSVYVYASECACIETGRFEQCALNW